MRSTFWITDVASNRPEKMILSRLKVVFLSRFVARYLKKNKKQGLRSFELLIMNEEISGIVWNVKELQGTLKYVRDLQGTW